jgi:acetaldehyde dehydrogenase (acetylating)
MQTTVYAKIKNPDIVKISASINAMMLRISSYVPGYELLVPPVVIGEDIVMVTVKVLGEGDYLPKYAGNLDIINCAAVGVAEEIATNTLELTS